jgi:predicted hotdog family 3-hydroxylacyl-ACP dehydratase
MGDTLTHLPSHAAVETLLAEIATALAPGGVFACTFRNYTRELADEARFILVRSDLDRILTCFLEYGPDTVTVHDVLHERAADGWRMRIGSYLKLRLAPESVREILERHGCSVVEDTGPGGMVRLRATRTAAP